MAAPKISATSIQTPDIMTKAKVLQHDASAQQPASYEAALSELEQLVGRIESGQMPLEQLLTGYQRAAQLLQFCKERLDAVESQIRILDEGTLKPWTAQ